MKKEQFKILFIYANLKLQTTFPMGIALLSAILKKEGFDVDIFDTTFYDTESVTSDDARVENLQIAKFSLGKEFRKLPGKNQMVKDLIRKVESYQPDLMGFSILEDIFPLSLELLKNIKKFNIPTIAGGIFPTFAPDKVISTDGIDMLCIGEGEEALVEVCKCLKEKKSPVGIKNIWVKQNGEVLKSEIRKPRDLSLNPNPDFELFDERRFSKPMKGRVYRMGLVETHRGCPYNCRFCISSTQNKFYRKSIGAKYFRSRDIGSIYDEIKILIDHHKIEFIYFPSEVIFAESEAYIKEFAKMYQKFKIPFFCQNRAECINENTVKYLIDMNCHSLAIGIEHGNEEFRVKVLGRNISNETYINALKLLENTGIKVSVNNIVGFPDETRALAFDTIMLNRKLKAYQVNGYFFTPYHGTELRDYCVKQGYIKDETQVCCVTKNTELNMPKPYLSPDEIRGLVRTFNLYVRFDKNRFHEIEIAEKFTIEGNQMFQKLKDEYWNHYLK